MERLLTKERIRCDRYEQYFSLIVVHFNQVPEVTRATQEHSLTRFLSTNLRLIDDFGVLRNGGLGVLLPMTDIDGGKVVLRKVLNHADQHGLSIEADVFAYHGRLNTSSKDKDANDIDDSYHDHLESHDHLGGLGNANDEPLEDKIQAFRNHWDSKSATDGFPKNEAESLTSRPRLHAPQSDVIVSDIKTNINRSDSAIQYFDRNSAEILKLCTPSYPIWKRQLDIIGASIGLIGSFPILVIAGVAIKFTSTGPVFFKQSRCGHYGKPFLIYKLRTMSENAEQTKHLFENLNERDGPAFKIQNDPRVTRVGKFLRATGIDELPQLINVLKGEMAIVGPRPLPVSEDQECATWQQRRLDTKPGITCLWQISKSRKMTFDEWMRLDLHYLKKRSPIYDASLIVRTIKAVFTGRVGH